VRRGRSSSQNSTRCGSASSGGETAHGSGRAKFGRVTDRAKGLAGEYLQAGYRRVRDRLARRGGVETIVRDAVEHAHPDTAMAHAFEEAVV
jgi:hypothetical protein